MVVVFVEQKRILLEEVIGQKSLAMCEYFGQLFSRLAERERSKMAELLSNTYFIPIINIVNRVLVLIE